MNMDSTVNAVKEEPLQLEETGDSWRLKITDIVSLSRDTDGFCTTECVSGDELDKVKQENLEHEPDDVLQYLFIIPEKHPTDSW